MSEDIFRKLQATLQEGGSIFDENLLDGSILPFNKMEKLILYGCVMDGAGNVNRAEEEIIGRLIALGQGIIVLCPVTENTSPPYGLIKHYNREGDFDFFYLQSFFPVEQIQFNIYPSTFSGWGKSARKAGCPAWIKWEMGQRHLESYVRLGIEKERWKILSAWFKKWLI